MKHYVNKYLATGLLAMLPLAAFAQEARPGEDIPQPPAAAQTTVAAQPSDSGQSEVIRADPVAPAPQPLAREIKSERELAAQVDKAKSLVSQIGKALKSARTDTERERLRNDLSKANANVGDLEKKLVDAATKLSAATAETAAEKRERERTARETAQSEAAYKAEQERLQKESEQRRMYIYYTALAAGVLIALGALVATYFHLRSRNRSKKLARDLEKHKQAEELRDSADDWLLTGEQGRLKLRGVLLATEGRGSIVGRGETEADVIIEDKDDSVSRRHARFFYRDDALYVEDLRSLNGTFVNGERLNAGRVKLVRDQDELHFGKLNFTLRRA